MTDTPTPSIEEGRAAELLAFLNGSGELDGCSFGDDTKPPSSGRYWWRKDLALVAPAATITALQSELAEMREALEYVKAELLADPCPISRRHVRRRVDAILKDRPNTAKENSDVE